MPAFHHRQPHRRLQPLRSGGTGAVIGSGTSISLGGNVVTAVTNDTNVTGSIAGNNLTLGWTGLLGTGTRRSRATSFTQGQLLSFNGTSFVSTSTIGNNQLQNNTISGVSLGGNLFNLSALNSSLTFSGSYNGSAAQTIGLNQGYGNWWTANQNFTTATTSGFEATSTNVFFDGFKNAILSTNANGQVQATTSIGINYLTGTLGVGNGGTGSTTLSSTLLVGNGTSGVTSYTGSGCTNQFIRSINGAGAAICATVANTDLAHSTIVVNGVTLTLGDTTDTIATASSTLLSDNNNWTGTETFMGTPTFGSGIVQLLRQFDDHDP